MTAGKALGVSACVLAIGVAASAPSGARAMKCANPREVAAMQAAAVQQELMDAALTCGDNARVNYNAFQTRFAPELRLTDKTMLRMFSRVMGNSQGDKAYNLFKTELATKAELRRIRSHEDFCREANLVVAAALGPQKIALGDFVAGIPTFDVTGPVGRCDVEVAVTLRGAKAVPLIVPRPNPLRTAVAPQTPALPAAAPPSSAPGGGGDAPLPGAQAAASNPL